MARRTVEERIADIEAKENALKQQKKKLKAEQSKQRRNARTKRLIELGAEVKSIINLSDDELLSDDYCQTEAIKKLVSSYSLPEKTKIANTVLAIIEFYIDRNLEMSDMQKFKNFIELQESRGYYFSNALNKSPSD